MEWAAVEGRGSLLATALVAFGVYYLTHAVKRPRVVCREGAWRDFLACHVTLLHDRYWPTPWCVEAYLQTFLSTAIRQLLLPRLQYDREILRLRDGGEVALDWLEGKGQAPFVTTRTQGRARDKGRRDKGRRDKGCSEGPSHNGLSCDDVEELLFSKLTPSASEKKLNTSNNPPSASEKPSNTSQTTSKPSENPSKKPENPSKKPENPSQKPLPGLNASAIALILPGLTGSSESPYVAGLVRSLHHKGVTCVVLNSRGTGGTCLKTTRTYCAANSDDLEETLDHLAATRPNAHVLAVGISLGGLILCHYLTTRGDKAATKMVAAGVISVPMNLVSAIRHIERPGLGNLFNRYLAHCLAELVAEHQYMLEGDHDWDYERVVKSRTVREFDNLFTSKQFGFRDAEQYYLASTLYPRLHCVRVPLLCLNSTDDLFMHTEDAVIEAVNQSSHVALVLTARGGHIGFMEGLLPANSTYSDRLFCQVVEVVLANLEAMSEVKREADQYARNPGH